MNSHSINSSHPATLGHQGQGHGGAAKGAAPRRRPFTRAQRLTVVYGILCIVLMLVILQLWLLVATMNAFLGGDQSVIWPAAAVSIACLLLNLGLLRYLYRMEKP